MLTTTVKIEGDFACTLERAFKAPILGDATKFLDGRFLQPAVVRFEDDETWGKVGGVRFPVTMGNLLCPAGRLFEDRILQRVENDYWEWTIFDLQIPTLFFVDRAVAKWRVWQVATGRIRVSYAYTFYSKYRLLHPLTWIFVNLQWRMTMTKALSGIRDQAESGKAFYYEL